MSESDFHDPVTSRLDAIEAALRAINKTLGNLEAKMHLPAACELAERVRGLELKEAKQAGMLAAVGVIAGLVASGVITLVSVIIKK